MEILADLDAAFAADPLIDELGVVLSAEPPFIVLVEHKLGIAAPALKPLLKHALAEFYKHSLHLDDGALDNPLLIDRINSLSRAILCIRGNFPLAFSVRKRLILEHRLLTAQSELNFLNVLFTKHPKCPSSWEHRRWCIAQQCEQSGPGKMVLSAAAVECERKLCTEMAEKYAKNYYAWMHRIWLLDFMSTEILEQELIFTKTWLLHHVSDHCASNHRLQVLLRLLKAPHSKPLESSIRSSSMSFFSAKIDRISEAMLESEVLVQSRPGSETLWYHRRDLSTLLLDLLCPSFARGMTTTKYFCEEDLKLLLTATTEEADTAMLAGTDSGMVTAGVGAYTVGPASVESNSNESSSSHPLGEDGGPQQRINLENVWNLWSQLLCRQYTTRHPNIQNSKRCLQLVDTWLQYEAALCKGCAEVSCQWNAAQQRSYAIRYLVSVQIQCLQMLEKIQKHGDRSAQDFETIWRAALLQNLEVLTKEDGFNRCWEYLLKKYSLQSPS